MYQRPKLLPSPRERASETSTSTALAVLPALRTVWPVCHVRIGKGDVPILLFNRQGIVVTSRPAIVGCGSSLHEEQRPLTRHALRRATPRLPNSSRALHQHALCLRALHGTAHKSIRLNSLVTRPPRGSPRSRSPALSACPPSTATLTTSGPPRSCFRVTLPLQRRAGRPGHLDILTTRPAGWSQGCSFPLHQERLNAVRNLVPDNTISVKQKT